MINKYLNLHLPIVFCLLLNYYQISKMYIINIKMSNIFDR